MKIKQSFTDLLKKLTTEKKRVLHDSCHQDPQLQFRNFLIWHTFNEIQGKLIYDSE
jgi:hypothetical protein